MYKKKLIEVALPLEDINIASGREKSIRHGHPSTMHLWWARRPLATARAVLFASIVDDPSSHPEEYPTVQEQDKRREELFDIIRNLVIWKNLNNEELLNLAKKEMLKYTDKLPAIYDPFCGGGTIPIEAQRLGLNAFGSDLNPVAVTISKGLTELPYPYRDQPPVNPEAKNGISEQSNYKELAGLAADVRYYSEWMSAEAYNRIGSLFPKIEVKNGADSTVIAWVWARTVICPNPACACEMPLVRSWWLSKKKGKESWIVPIKQNKKIEYKVVTGKGNPSEGTVNRRGATCVCCGNPVKFEYIRSEGRAGRMGSQLMAIVGEGDKGREYNEATEEHIKIAQGCIRPDGIPDAKIPFNPRDLKTPNYGMTKYSDLFTNRQLTALITFSDLVNEARVIIYGDACAAGHIEASAKRYADVVSVYLAFAVDKLADYNSSICSWITGRETIRNTFARQAIPMVWDFTEVNPFSGSTGSFANCFEWAEKCLLASSSNAPASIVQNNAMEKIPFSDNLLISTDPPYYDNIGYADLSDFFYIWLRRSLRTVFPDIFSTMLVPKTSELIATPYRHNGDMNKAKVFFEEGLFRTFQNIYAHASDDYPVTIYYAFKQTDSESDENIQEEDERSLMSLTEASSGWETMLSGLIRSGFTITGTWPMRTEMSNRSIASGANALASSIVLVCRKRNSDASMITRREFANLLKSELRTALKELQSGNIAPVDLAQASIGPGMAVFSRYSQVLDSTGTPMTIRSALQMINQYLDEFLTEQEGEMDAESRLCVTLYSEYGVNEVPYGDVDVVARAKNTSLEHLERVGVLIAQKGKVRLLRRDELDLDWHPIGKEIGKNIVWLNTQQLAARLQKEGEKKSAELFIEIGSNMADCVRALTYRLFAIAEKKGWTEDALAYNSVIASWNNVQNSAASIKENHSNTTQMSIDDLGGH